MIKVCAMIIALQSLTTTVVGQDIFEYRANSYLMGLHRISVGGNIASFSIFEFGQMEVNDDSTQYYYVPVLTYGSTVYRDFESRNSQYSYALPVNLGLWIFYRLALAGSHSDTSWTPDSKLKYFLFAPNCRVDTRLGARTWFSYGATTDYLFARKRQNPPGILFRPFAGLTVQSGKLSHDLLWTLSIGPTLFWNFDGPSKSDSWMIRLSMTGNFVGH